MSEFFQFPNRSNRSTPVVFTQPLTEWITKTFSFLPWGGGGGVKNDRIVIITITPPSMSRSSRQYESLSISHTPVPPLPITRDSFTISYF
jgi:hypothetical protein